MIHQTTTNNTSMKTNHPKSIHRPAAAIVAALALASLLACGDSQDGTAAANDEAGPLAGWFTTDPITTGGEPIHRFRQSAEPGDQVAFSGKVMGRMQVFVPGRAAFIVGDPDTITTCDLIPGDDCETPWDACCEDPDNIAAGIVTVQLVDDDGRVLPHEIRGVNGLTELSQVSIEGTVADASGNGNLIIEATRIHVHPGG